MATYGRSLFADIFVCFAYTDADFVPADCCCEAYVLEIIKGKGRGFLPFPSPGPALPPGPPPAAPGPPPPLPEPLPAGPVSDGRGRDDGSKGFGKDGKGKDDGGSGKDGKGKDDGGSGKDGKGKDGKGKDDGKGGEGTCKGKESDGSKQGKGKRPAEPAYPPPSAPKGKGMGAPAARPKAKSMPTSTETSAPHGAAPSSGQWVQCWVWMPTPHASSIPPYMPSDVASGQPPGSAWGAEVVPWWI